MNVSLLVVRVQTLELALLATSVREIVGKRDWIPVPCARMELPGVMAWAGRAVAMLDLGRIAPGLRPLDPGEQRARALIVEVQDSILAIPADWVSEVRTVTVESLGPRRAGDLPFVRQEVDFGDVAVPLLDPILLLNGAGADADRS